VQFPAKQKSGQARFFNFNVSAGTAAGSNHAVNTITLSFFCPAGSRKEIREKQLVRHGDVVTVITSKNRI